MAGAHTSLSCKHKQLGIPIQRGGRGQAQGAEPAPGGSGVQVGLGTAVWILGSSW